MLRYTRSSTELHLSLRRSPSRRSRDLLIGFFIAILLHISPFFLFRLQKIRSPDDIPPLYPFLLEVVPRSPLPLPLVQPLPYKKETFSPAWPSFPDSDLVSYTFLQLDLPEPDFSYLEKIPYTPYEDQEEL